MKETPLTPEIANRVFDVLLAECGVSEPMREDFVFTQTRKFCPEFRFQGLMGFGGKFYRGYRRWYVSCYTEDITPERVKMIEKADAKIIVIQKEFEAIS